MHPLKLGPKVADVLITRNGQCLMASKRYPQDAGVVTVQDFECCRFDDNWLQAGRGEIIDRNQPRRWPITNRFTAPRTRELLLAEPPLDRVS